MSQIAEGSIIAGKYQLERTLARGGMGSVWVAKHLQLEMRVAIKFMDAAFAQTADGWARFSREAKAVAQIQSPNVIQVHDYGVEGQTPYIAMELLQGEDLGTRLKRAGRLHISAAAPIVTQMGRALRKAHEAGIVHRDLKPANVFLVRNDDEEIVKVLDFGIAKMTGTGHAGDATATGVVLGSAHYMSPEQVRGSKQLDWRSDLWSLAVIAFRTVTGRLPFPGEQIGDVLVGICSDPIPLASSIAPDLGSEVDAFFVHALSRNPAERFQSARDLAAAFASLGTMSSPSFGMSPGAPVGAMTPGPARAPAPSFSDSGGPFAGRAPQGSSPHVQAQVPFAAAPYAPAPYAPAPLPLAPRAPEPIATPPAALAPAFSPPAQTPLASAPTPQAWQGPEVGTLTSAAQSADLAPHLRAAPSSGRGVPGIIIAGAVLGALSLVGVGLMIGLRKPAGEVSADTTQATTVSAPAKQEPRVEPAPTPLATAPALPEPTAAPPPTGPAQPTAAPPAPPASSAAQPAPPPPKATANAAAPPGPPAKKAVETPKKGEGPKKNEELGF